MRWSLGLLASALLVLVCFLPQDARAAISPASHGLDGASLGLPWTLPFAGLLLAIATGPLFFPHAWERHHGRIAALFAVATMLPLAYAYGVRPASNALAATLLLEYLPFIVVLFTLFTISGGILLRGDLRGTPAVNTVLLATGAAMASLVGTTGASMILIRPILRANADRRWNVHVVVFFIFLVSNVGGGLTPLGDPPLFVGFLKGVRFFWTAEHLLSEILSVSAALLAIFFVLDSVLYRREARGLRRHHAGGKTAVTLKGGINLVLLFGVVAVILSSANWTATNAFRVLDVEVPVKNVVRDALLLSLAAASLTLTREEHRAANGFTWGPIEEVAKLFAGIFVCIIPVLAMLAVGRDGALGWLLAAVTAEDGSPNERAYFWFTGILSAFLDNAPTYLVFFELAGGDPVALMGPHAATLSAISLGAVLFGALTYIGNAPNFMVYAIAREAGVRMPSFFGYMTWSVAVLAPLFLLVTFVFVPAS